LELALAQAQITKAVVAADHLVIVVALLCKLTQMAVAAFGEAVAVVV
jgi:hypothetical protein